MSKQSFLVDLLDEDILEQCCLLPDFSKRTERTEIKEKENMSKYERFVQILEDHGYKHEYFANRCVFFKSEDSKYDIAEHCGDFFMVVDGKFKYEKKIKTEEQLIKYIHLADQMDSSSRKIVEMKKELYNIFK
jgi:hypothetical protein